MKTYKIPGASIFKLQYSEHVTCLTEPFWIMKGKTTFTNRISDTSPQGYAGCLILALTTGGYTNYTSNREEWGGGGRFLKMHLKHWKLKLEKKMRTHFMKRSFNWIKTSRAPLSFEVNLCFIFFTKSNLWAYYFYMRKPPPPHFSSTCLTPQIWGMLYFQ